MSKDLKVVWTANAVEDLRSIRAFISQDSLERAEAWLIELFDAGESLAEFYHRGRIVPEFNQENLRELLIENYRLVYRIKSSSIEIITVFEGHRQLTKKSVE